MYVFLCMYVMCRVIGVYVVAGWGSVGSVVTGVSVGTGTDTGIGIGIGIGCMAAGCMAKLAELSYEKLSSSSWSERMGSRDTTMGAEAAADAAVTLVVAPVESAGVEPNSITVAWDGVDVAAIGVSGSESDSCGVR